MVLHCCLLSLLHYNVLSLCRSFVTTELVYLWDEESARTLRRQVAGTPPLAQCGRKQIIVETFA